VSRSGRGLSGDIWKVLDQDNLSFLAQNALFQGLPRAEIERLADQLEERRFDRNQVILWQGGCSDCLCLIKHGLVEITHLCPNGRVEKLDYLKSGDALGEMSFITRLSSTTTATALSRVDLLQIPRPVLEDLLARYGSVAVELARVMGRQLSSTTARLSSLTTETRLCVLIGTRPGAGCTTLGAAMALALAPMAGGRTVYTEQPAPSPLPAFLSLASQEGVYHHPGGYDVASPRDDHGWPPHVRATLALDQLKGAYTHIIASLPEGISDKSAYWIEQADQVILVTPPDQASAKSAGELRARLKGMARPDGANWFTVVNRASPADQASAAVEGAEYDIPYLPDLPPLADLRPDNLPAALAQTVQALANRLGRTYWIGIYVPTTIAVNQQADTHACLDKTLAFMGQLFGGATSHQVQGVWGSQSADLVSETIFIVRSYVTRNDLDCHLPSVIEYVESLKQELKQEAMAIEVNQRLMLI
jgi:CRP-like cAMP-binding protein